MFERIRMADPAIPFAPPAFLKGPNKALEAESREAPAGALRPLPISRARRQVAPLLAGHYRGALTRASEPEQREMAARRTAFQRLKVRVPEKSAARSLHIQAVQAAIFRLNQSAGWSHRPDGLLACGDSVKNPFTNSGCNRALFSPIGVTSA